MAHHHRGAPLAPAGGKMNDAGYPFRGEYRVDKKLNHGHGGISRVLPSSFGIHISGENILLSDINVPKNLHLDCELAVGHERPQLITFPFADSTLSVPPDGREYHFTAVVSGPQQKHYAKMVFQNTGKGVGVAAPLRILHDHSVPMPLKFVYPDGHEVRPMGGMYNLTPSPGADGLIRLVADGPSNFGDTSNSGTSLRFMCRQGYESGVLVVENPVTGRQVRLDAYGALNGLDELLVSGPGTTLNIVVPPLTPGHVAAAPEDQSAATPEVDTNMGLLPDRSLSFYTVRAPGFDVDISCGGGAHPATGHGFATLEIPSDREHRIRFTLRCPRTGKTVLSQNSVIPALGLSNNNNNDSKRRNSSVGVVVPIRMSDNAADPSGSLHSRRDTLRITSGPNYTVSSESGDTAPGLAGIDVDPTVPQSITIKSPQTGAEATINLAGLSASEPQWVSDLAKLLRGRGGPHEPKRRRDDTLAGLRGIHPLSPSGKAVIDALQNLLGAAPPSIQMTLGENGLQLRGVRVRGGTVENPLFVESAHRTITETSTLPLSITVPTELQIKNGSNDIEATITITPGEDCGGAGGGPKVDSAEGPDGQFLRDLTDAMDRYVPGATGNSPDAWDGPALGRLSRDLARCHCPTTAASQYLPRLMQLLRKACSDADFVQDLAAALARCPDYFQPQPPSDRTFFQHLGAGIGRMDAHTSPQQRVREHLSGTFSALNPTSLRMSNPHNGCPKHPLPIMRIDMDGTTSTHRLDGEVLLPGTKIATVVAGGPCCGCLDRGSTSPFVRELADAYKVHQRNHTPVQSLRDDWSAIRPGDEDEADLQWALKRLLDALIDASEAARRAAELANHNSNASAPLSMYPSITYEVNHRAGCLDNVQVQPQGDFHMVAFLDGAQQQLPVANGCTVPHVPLPPVSGNAKRTIDLVVKDLQGNVVTRTSVTLGAPSTGGPVGNLDVSIVAENNDTVVRMAVDAPYKLQWREDNGDDATTHYQRLMRATAGPFGQSSIINSSTPAAPTAALKLDSTVSHQLVVTVVDSAGRAIHESRVGVPRLSNPGCTVSWKDNTVVATPDARTIFTASLDGAQERVIAHPMAMDPDTPHQLRLRHMHTDGRSAKLGEILLDMPAFIDPRDLEDIIRILHGNQTTPGRIPPALSQLLNTARGSTTKKLIHSILEALRNGGGGRSGVEEEDETLKYKRRHGHQHDGSEDPSKHIFFRLRGDEAKRN